MDLQIHHKYSFDTNAPSILTTRVSNAKLVARTNFEQALSVDRNLINKFNSILPLLPTGTPDSYLTSIYNIFETLDGSKIVMADVWINSSTIVEVENIRLMIEVRDAVTEDILLIRDSLTGLGKVDFSITQL